MSDRPVSGKPAPRPVGVAVLTFRRPDHARMIVPALDEAMAEVRDGRAMRLIVVDNDPDAGARRVITAAAGDAVHEVVYVHEPAPGIAAARNAALSACREDALVFIDDDERPEPGWLPALIDTWERTGAEAVVGPVLPRFQVEPPEWIIQGGWFDHGRRRTGALVGAAATNNLLLDTRFLVRHGLRFDDAFGLTGGEDTMLTRALVRDGGSIVWCDEAVVRDEVPASRLTSTWLRHRAYRSGNTSVIVDVALARQVGALTAGRVRVRGAGTGVMRVCVGATMIAAARLRHSPRAHTRAVRVFERGRGMLAASCGRSFLEYERR